MEDGLKNQTQGEERKELGTGRLTEAMSEGKVRLSAQEC